MIYSVLFLASSLLSVEAFTIAPAFHATPLTGRLTQSQPPCMVATAEEIQAAAKAVKVVAAKFGKDQKAAAEKWVDAVTASDDGCPTGSLLEEQLVLFEECLLDDEGGKCKELDAALTAFEEALDGSASAPAPKKGPRFSFGGGGNKKERAAARVRAAAGKFGSTQKQVAQDWTAKAILLGTPEDGPSLMEQQLALFGECQVGADGTPDPKCIALYEALDNLQVALTGSVQAPTATSAATSAAAAMPGSGPGPQAGQTAFFGSKRPSNNGCWPYN